MERWIVGGALILATILLAHWCLNKASRFVPEVTPDGQFPIEEQETNVWPASFSQMPFRPSRFTDEYRSTELVDPKRICGRRLYED